MADVPKTMADYLTSLDPRELFDALASALKYGRLYARRDPRLTPELRAQLEETFIAAQTSAEVAAGGSWGARYAASIAERESRDRMASAQRFGQSRAADLMAAAGYTSDDYTEEIL